MNISALSLLVGLIFELTGAFLLSVESIGLDLIRSWRRTMIEPAKQVLEESDTRLREKKAEAADISWLPTAVRFAASFLGGALGILIPSILLKDSAGRSYLIIVAGLTSGVVFLIVFFGAKNIVSTTVFFLEWVEQKAGQGSLGLTGFVILSIGFIFQFVGTIPFVV